MSHLPEGPSGWQAWFGFLAVYLLLCVFFPPLLGVAFGILKFVIPCFVIYRLLGGRGKIIG